MNEPDLKQAFDLAFAMHGQGRLAEAETLYRGILSHQRRHADATHLLGALCHQTGRAREAVTLMRRAADLAPKHAAVQSNLGMTLQSLGRGAEAEAAYRKALDLQPRFPEALTNLGGLLNDLGRPGEARPLLEKALKLAPKSAMAAMNLGNVLRAGSDPRAALVMHRRAARLMPASEQAQLNLATTLMDLEQLDAARLALRRAALAAPALVEAWNNIGYLALNVPDFAAAEHAFRRAVALAPTYAAPRSGLAECAYLQDRVDEAIGLSERALALSPKDPQIRMRHALRLLAGGRIEAGRDAWEARLEKPDAIQRVGVPPRWRGEPLDGRRIVICAEEGVGDEVLYAECFNDLIGRAGHVFIECDPRIATLFARSFPAATVRPYQRSGGRFKPVQGYDWLPADPPVNYSIDAGSLPRLLRPTLADYGAGGAFLKPDPVRVTALRTRLDGLGPGLKVGFSWRSRLLTSFRNINYARLEDWRDVLADPEWQIVSMQYGDGWQAEIARARRDRGARIHVFDDLDLTDDFEAIAALAAAVDLLVCPSSTLGWLGGAVGTPTWVTHIRPLYVRLGTGGFPGFGSVVSFDKAVPEPWDGVVDRVHDALRRYTAAMPGDARR